MNIIETEADLFGALLLQGKSFSDNRGWFRELARTNVLKELGIEEEFLQDNYSFSYRNVVRGLHYQLKHPQAKLVTVLTGAITDVIVDLRKGSPVFGKPIHFTLDKSNDRTLYIPKGFAHGFGAWSDDTVVLYKCSDYYYHDDQYGINPLDPTLNIDWCLNSEFYNLSDKDKVLPDLHEVPDSNLFEY